MEADFWHRRWRKNEIGFHLAEVNPLLIRFFAALALPAHSRVFVPLCGKTRDIGWLLQAGYRVVGAELNESAVQQLFQELGITPTVLREATRVSYQAQAIQIEVGDILTLDTATLGPADAMYDRAALVALPAQMRQAYAAQLIGLYPNAAQLLISFDYQQALLAGPPFAVPSADIHELYGAHYDCQRLASEPLDGGLKGQCPAHEEVWLLAPKR
ncbi:thiopurine S-methyltransferase [Atopomonas sediminilitoris]|uniref:thiopurine S-methyltransferase n=1 Tax=Atopomonas sediminilitoris TaxID=2919919 RepID=UPI001F4E606C|nr:thiopurine S-methyltransferase [Atopomonas sediminilitoris]MCJ8169371.1 thiopurine S-methyltransferase [Atopomonas sediminilitoris]